jgi:Mrp family chromosome partitioning ATPase
MLPYAEAVRDRLFAFFDSEGLYAKTKLIGISGFSAGAGASTLAASLAAALSDIDANKVLLVDMNVAHGASHAFFGGKPADLSEIDLQADPVEGAETVAAGEEGEEDEELLMAKQVFGSHGNGNGHHQANGNGIPSLLNGSGTPGLKEFRHMMGKLKPSGYDYVVFDMPPVSAISPSAAMAGLMDHVLAVVESEATIADQVKRGYRDLVTAHATVSVVFNKVRTYGPQALAGI